MSTFRINRAEALRVHLEGNDAQTSRQIADAFLVSVHTAKEMIADLREQLAGTGRALVFLDGAYWLTDDKDTIDEWVSARARALETGTQTVVNASQGFQKLSATQAVAKLTEV